MEQKVIVSILKLKSIYGLSQEQFDKLAYLDKTIDVTQRQSGQQSCTLKTQSQLKKMKAISESVILRMATEITLLLAKLVGVQEDTLYGALSHIRSKLKIDANSLA